MTMASAPLFRRAALRSFAPQLALLLMVLIWAVNFSVAKRALELLTPLAFNALRFPFASLFVLAVLLQRGPIPFPARRDVWRVLWLGILCNVIYQQFFIFGLAATRAGTASVLLASTPILTALLSAVLGHETIRARAWVGVCATFIGIVIVVGASARESGGLRASLAGDLLLLAASLSWAIFTVASRKLVHHYGSLAVTAWTLWVGTIGVCVLGAPDVSALEVRAIPLSAWLAVVYAGALSVGFAYVLWTRGVRQLGATRAAVYSNLVPAVALTVAWLWLGEPPTLGQIAGAAVIIGGVTITQRYGPGVQLPVRDAPR
jgi:drug/metabolite transporter (DMT)-like permease